MSRMLLPTELVAQNEVGVAGFEPTAHWSQTSCATKLRYTPPNRFRIKWQGQKDLNPRHAVLETAALPTELYPYKSGEGEIRTRAALIRTLTV